MPFITKQIPVRPEEQPLEPTIPGFVRTLVIGLGREQALVLNRLADRQPMGTQCILLVPPHTRKFWFPSLRTETGDPAAIERLQREVLKADLVIILASIEDETVIPLVDAIPRDEDSGPVRISMINLFSRDQISESSYAKKLLSLLKKKSDSVMIIEGNAHKEVLGAPILNESQEAYDDHVVEIILSVLEAFSAERRAANSSMSSLRSTLENAGLALASFRMFGLDYGMEMLKDVLSSSVSPCDIRNASHAFVLVHGPNEASSLLEGVIHDLVSQALGSEIAVNARYVASSSYGSPGRFLVLLAGLQDDCLIDWREELFLDMYQMEKDVETGIRIELDLPIHQLENY